MSTALKTLLVIILFIIVLFSGYATCALMVSGRISDLYGRIQSLKKLLRKYQDEEDMLRLQVNDKWRPFATPLRFPGIDIDEQYSPEDQAKAVSLMQQLAEQVSEQETPKPEASCRNDRDILYDLIGKDILNQAEVLAIDHMIAMLDHQPAVKQAQWVVCNDPDFYKCSSCGEQHDWRHKHCPDCGAKMWVNI